MSPDKLVECIHGLQVISVQRLSKQSLHFKLKTIINKRINKQKHPKNLHTHTEEKNGKINNKTT